MLFSGKCRLGLLKTEGMGKVVFTVGQFAQYLAFNETRVLHMKGGEKGGGWGRQARQGGNFPVKWCYI